MHTLYESTAETLSYTWYERIMDWTDKWSSIVFSSTGMPCSTACLGNAAGTDDIIAALRVGGAVYAWPGGAPLAVWRKKASHDWEKNVGCDTGLNNR